MMAARSWSVGVVVAVGAFVASTGLVGAAVPPAWLDSGSGAGVGAAVQAADKAILLDQSSGRGDGKFITNEPHRNQFDSRGALDLIVPSATTWDLDSVDLWLLARIPQAAASVGNFDIRISIWPNSGGQPGSTVGGTPLCSGARVFTGSAGWPRDTAIDLSAVEVTLSGSCLLSGGTYWLVVEALASAPDNWLYWAVRTPQVGAVPLWNNSGGGFEVGCTSWGSLAGCGQPLVDGPPEWAARVEGTATTIAAHEVQYSSTIVGAPTWFRPSAENCSGGTQGPYGYHVQPFRVAASGSYLLESIQSQWDGFLFLYQGSFNPAAPTGGCVVGDDDGPGGVGTSTLSRSLVAGIQYYLVTTSWNGGSGAFTNRIEGPGAIVLGSGDAPEISSPETISTQGGSPGVRTALDGTRVVTWIQGTDLFCFQLFTPDGSPRSNAVAAGRAVPGTKPIVAVGPDGGFTVVWEGGDLSNSLDAKAFGGIWGRAFDPIGNPTNNPVQITTDGTNPVAARNSVGRSYVVWERIDAGLDSGEKGGSGLWGRVIDPTGNPAGNAANIDATGGNAPQIVTGRTDEFRLGFRRGGQGLAGVKSGETFWGRVITPTGGVVPGEEPLGGPAQGVGSAPDVGVDPSGETVLVFGDDRGVRGSRRKSTGEREETTVATSQTTSAGPTQVAVGTNLFGDVVVGWNEPTGAVAVQTLDADLAATSAPVVVPDGGGNVSVTLDASGVATVAYETDGGGVNTRSVQSSVASACESAFTLCALSDRFTIDVTWKKPDGSTGLGTAVALTGQAGYFWFFSPANVELIVKILDGRTVNGHFWVYSGAISDLEYTLVVTDRETGNAAIYENAQGQLQSIADTRALPASVSLAGVTYARRPMVPQDEESLGEIATGLGLAALPVSIGYDAAASKAACSPNSTTLCLRSNRLALRMTWRTPQGTNGTGKAVPLGGSDTTGYFWFFNAENAEVVVKILDGRTINGFFWVFYGALTNVEYELAITDTNTGVVYRYNNAQGNLASVADTEAIPGP